MKTEVMIINVIKDQIMELKDEKNAIILAHNYQPKEIQEISDFIGDSLELCIKASEIEDKDLVIFCGVDFMAETAFILNPDKKIVIPDLNADCKMANMLNEEELLEAIEKHPDASVVLYVNSIATAKQHADTLCTSANAVQVVNSLDSDKILFGPDKNLANHIAEKVDKEIIPVPKNGNCYVHDNITVEDIKKKRIEYPNAEIICHPECRIEVQHACDEVLSTGGMLKYIAESDKEEFILGTEVDMVTRLNREVPEKKVYPLVEDAICETMKVHSLEKVKKALEEEKPEIILPEDVCKKSLKAVEHMLNASK